MPTRKLSDPTLYKVRIIVAGGAILHLVSRGAPVLVRSEGHLNHVKADWVTGSDADAGDTLAYIDWNQVVAITWRRAV